MWHSELVLGTGTGVIGIGGKGPGRKRYLATYDPHRILSIVSRYFLFCFLGKFDGWMIAGKKRTDRLMDEKKKRNIDLNIQTGIVYRQRNGSWLAYFSSTSLLLSCWYHLELARLFGFLIIPGCYHDSFGCFMYIDVLLHNQSLI